MNNPSVLGGRKEGLWQEYRHNYTYWCVVTMHFPLLEVEDVKCSPPDDKVYKGNVVRDVIVFVPINNGIYTKVPFDDVVNDTDGVFITETPEVIYVSQERSWMQTTIFMVWWGCSTFVLIE